MSGSGIRIADMPDIGAVTDDSSFVGEHSGSGRFAATALRDYMTTSGGGPYLPLAGGTLTGDLSTNATADIHAQHDLTVGNTFNLGSADGYLWKFQIDGSGNKIEIYDAGGNYDAFIPTTGLRSWNGNVGTLMSLSATGTLSLRTELDSPQITVTNANVTGTLTAGAITTSGTATTGNISAANINASGPITTSGNLVGVNANISGQVDLGSGFRILVESGTNRQIYFSAGWCLSWNPSTGNLTYVRNGDNAALMSSIGATGEFVIQGSNAYKPGGGSWTAPSDSRVKTVTGDYTRGLADIKQLQPKRFTYIGNDTLEAPNSGESAPYTTSPNYVAAKAGTEFAGLVAQDVQAVMPEMVQSRMGYIDNSPVSDMLILDRSALDLALVNAIKELEQRVAALEALPLSRQSPPEHV